MDGATVLANLERSVECDICHNPMIDPRLLQPCLHTYCRHCLDDLLTFDNNGIATLKCPKNCVGETVVGPNETTKKLTTNFALLRVLDLINQSKKR